METWLIILTVILIVAVISLILGNILLKFSKNKENSDKNDKN